MYKYLFSAALIAVPSAVSAQDGAVRRPGFRARPGRRDHDHRYWQPRRCRGCGRSGHGDRRGRDRGGAGGGRDARAPPRARGHLQPQWRPGRVHRYPRPRRTGGADAGSDRRGTGFRSRCAGRRVRFWQSAGDQHRQARFAARIEQYDLGIGRDRRRARRDHRHAVGPGSQRRIWRARHGDRVCCGRDRGRCRLRRPQRVLVRH